MILESTKSAAMERSLSALWQRSQLIANNIANEDTPGYKGKRLAFEGILQQELDAANNSHTLTRSQKAHMVSNTRAFVYDDPELSTRADGNNVNLDNEHIEYARVQLQYQALKEKVSGHYTTLKYAISGGK